MTEQSEYRGFFAGDGGQAAGRHRHRLSLGRRRGGSLTYDELNRSSARIARGLEAVGIGHGVRTVLMVPPGLDLFPLAFGLFRAGAVPVLVDPGIGLKHLKACLGNAEPEAFIGVPKAHAARAMLGWARPTVRTKITVGRRFFWGGHTLDQIEALGSDAEADAVATTGADDVAAIVFTSGSTGPPKGVVYRHQNFAAQVEAITRTPTTSNQGRSTCRPSHSSRSSIPRSA